MKKVYLRIPSMEDLHYRQEWMKDSKTMSYNAGFDMDLKGYDKKTGTIIKTDEEMIEWYNRWINKEPDRFFAYIYIDEVEEPIGEIYYYPEGDTHMLGILITHKYRGKGYSYPALMELERIAFEKNNINELSDMITSDRISAIRVFKKAGFVFTEKDVIEKIFDKDSIIKQLLITKDMYFNEKRSYYE